MPGGEDKQINSQTRGLSRVYSSGQRRGRGSRNRGQRSGQAVVPGSTEGLLTQNDASGSAEASSENLSQRGRGNRRGGRDARGGQEGQGTAADAPSQADALKITETPTESSSRRGQRNRRGGQQHGNRGGLIQGPSRPAAHRAFGGRLTIEPDEEHNTTPQTLSLSADAPTFVPGQPLTVRSKSKPHREKEQRPKPPKSTHPDIGNRIHEDIANANYECIICSDEVFRKSKIWTCSGCWTVYHLKCVKQWHEKKKKEADLQATQGPQQEVYFFRCPAYRCAASEDSISYHCWCGKEVSPQPSSSVLPPHSCGQTCSKPRPTCPHPCTLPCHAGPCPPCDSMGPEQSCFCGKHMSRKTCRETDYQNGWACQEMCGDLLPCGDHFCPKRCHPGLCGDCHVLVDARCYCGGDEKQVACSNLEQPEQSYSAKNMAWFEGTFTCAQKIVKSFDCGRHDSHESCRSQDELPFHCPFSTDIVSHCPCGKTSLEELLPQPRQSCEDPIPHCERPCEKLLACGHLCKAICHLRDCPSCEQYMDISCNCGRVTTASRCHQGIASPPLCLRTCQANMSCGRHHCGEHCCSGEKKAAERQAAKRKKRLAGPAPPVEAEHICLRICGRPLKCGSHDCQQLCHSGTCGSCPEAIFEEISCACGRTVLHPPQPCGTRPPECRFQCQKQPRCGHARVAHNCHPDDTECPRCPYLTYKLCACGAEEVPNTPCHLQEARCGKVCGKKLKCALHKCRKLCHKPGECEKEGNPGQNCDQVCEKTKMFCEHTCQSSCHGQTSCNESSPCSSKVVVTCPCGQLKQLVKCLASCSNPLPDRPEIKCDDECLRHERNRRLAAALNIDTSAPLTHHIPYDKDTLIIFKEFTKWAESQERHFRVFAEDPNERSIRYKPTPKRQREFLHLLAEDFGLEHESQDTEPHRHVIIRKGVRFVSAPNKTIAQCLKIKEQQATETAAAAREITHNPFPRDDPFNALVLISPRFGLIIEDLRTALKDSLATQPSFCFNIDFLPTEEVLIRATPQYAATLSLQVIERTLCELKSKIAETVKRDDLAGNVLLCHVDAKNEILRREAPKRQADSSGWSAVASKAASRRASPSSDDPSAARSSGSGKTRLMLGLKKKGKPPEKPFGFFHGDAEC